MAGFLYHHDVASALRKQRRDGSPGRTPADHEYIARGLRVTLFCERSGHRSSTPNKFAQAGLGREEILRDKLSYEFEPAVSIGVESADYSQNRPPCRVTRMLPPQLGAEGPPGQRLSKFPGVRSATSGNSRRLLARDLARSLL
jgi:hypothetical protein